MSKRYLHTYLHQRDTERTVTKTKTTPRGRDVMCPPGSRGDTQRGDNPSTSRSLLSAFREGRREKGGKGGLLPGRGGPRRLGGVRGGEMRGREARSTCLFVIDDNNNNKRIEESRSHKSSEQEA